MGAAREARAIIDAEHDRVLSPFADTVTSLNDRYTEIAERFREELAEIKAEAADLQDKLEAVARAAEIELPPDRNRKPSATGTTPGSLMPVATTSTNSQPTGHTRRVTEAASPPPAWADRFPISRSLTPPHPRARTAARRAIPGAETRF